MQKVIVFLSANFQYQVVNDFLTGIAEAATVAGFTSLFLDVNAKGLSDSDQWQRLRLENVVALFSVNGLNTDLPRQIPELTGIPFFSLMVDHPIHHLHRVYGKAVHLLCVDQEHTAFMRAIGMQASDCLHAARPQQPHEETVTYQDKTGILFPASYMDPVPHLELVQQVFPDLATALQQAGTRSINQVLLMLGFMRPDTKPMFELNQDTLTLLRHCDSYLRARNRQQLLSDCAEQGISLSIIGHGWQQAQQLQQHRYLPAVDFGQLKNLIRHSRFVLHQSPGFRLGLHERLVYPLQLGTAVLAEQTPYLQQHWPPGTGLLTFNTVAQLVEPLTTLSADAYQQLVAQGQQQVLQQELWQHRFAPIKALLTADASAMLC